MNSIKWRIKAILEYYGFQKKISVRRREAVVKYNKASDRLYFIAGCGRSGTTLLGRLLSMTPGLCYMNEPRDFWTAINVNTDIWGYVSDSVDVSSFILEDAGEYDKERFSNLFYGYKESNNCDVLVEKTPENIFRIAWLKQIVDELKVIHIVRNGNDVARSIDKQADRAVPYGIDDMDNWYGKKFIKREHLINTARELGIHESAIETCNTSMEWGALEWICSTISYDRFKSLIPEENQMILKYEAILSSPWESYERLMEFIKIQINNELREQIEKYVKRPSKKKPQIELKEPLKELFINSLEKAGYV